MSASANLPLLHDIDRLSVPQLIGQLLVVGFDGTELPAALREDLSIGRRAGVIVFKRNITSLPALQALCADVARTPPAGLPALVAIDEEGGRVRRLPPPALELPPMRQLAQRTDAAFVERCARVLALELRCLGVTMNFAPVVDVDTNPDNPVIGDRAFGADPETVIGFARSVLEGFRAGGVLSCLKHFPGHGDTLLDSHLALPSVLHDRARLDAVELLPFRQLGALADSVMTAHVVYPALDQGPATLSKTIVTKLLREDMRFSGVVFSDDLEMKGIADAQAPEAAAVAALEAGCDVLLVCHDAELQARVHAALCERAQRHESFRRRCLDAAQRSLALRRRCPPQPGNLRALERLLRDEVEPLRAELQQRLA
jgi:beta-N-acetylhexosaminidase